MLRRLFSYLMLLTISAAGLVPAGWMPTHDGDGRVLLVICTTDGVQEQWVDLGEDSPTPHPTEQMDDRSCPFSALSAGATLPDTGPELALNTPLTARWADQSFTHHTAGFHWRYDARGPPALS